MVIDSRVYALLEPMSMQFHSDWNWIMKILTQINDISTAKKIGYHFHEEWKAVIDPALVSLETEKIVQVISEFLIWYEKNG